MEAYRDDLAYIHHTGFGDFAMQAGPELLKLFLLLRSSFSRFADGAESLYSMWSHRTRDGTRSQAEEDTAKRILTRRITTFRRIGRSYRRDEEIHRCLLYKGAELAAKLRETGFRVRVVRSYGKFRLYKNRIGFVARKPE